MIPKFTPQMKKEITKQWQEEFPSMATLRMMDFANILGPLVIGLTMRMHRIIDDYTPRLYIHVLCREWPNISPCVDISDGRVSTISPKDKYLKIADNLRKKAILPLEGDVKLELALERLKKHYDYMDHYYREVLGGKDGWYQSAIMFEIILYLAGWSGVESAIRNAEEFVEKRIRTFRSDYLVRKPSIEFVDDAPVVPIFQWFEEMKELIKDMEKLRNTVPKQIEALKLSKLPVRNIILE
jgi:hypothetical protein